MSNGENAGAAITRGHTVLSPSSAARWTICPASVQLCKDEPNESGPEAKLGTAAHRLAELVLTGQKDCQEANEIISNLPEEFVEAAAVYTDYVQSLVKDGAALEVEVPLDTCAVTGEPFGRGTADAIVCTSNTLTVIDLKTGRRLVDAVNNPQLFIYAAAAFERLDPIAQLEIDTVRAVIVQPLTGEEEHIKSWEIPVDFVADGSKVRLALRKVGERALELYNGATPEEKDFRMAANVCRYCLGKYKCPMHVAAVKDVSDLIPADSNEGAAAVQALREIPLPMTPEAIAKAHAFVPLIQQWCDAVEAKALQCLQSGTALPGLKLVCGRQGPRKWSDDAEACHALENALGVKGAYSRKPLTPAEAEKKFKAGEISKIRWGKLQRLMVRTAPKPVIASADDPRKEYGAAIDAEFDDLDNAKAN